MVTISIRQMKDTNQHIRYHGPVLRDLRQRKPQNTQRELGSGHWDTLEGCIAQLFFHSRVSGTQSLVSFKKTKEIVWNPSFG